MDSTSLAPASTLTVTFDEFGKDSNGERSRTASQREHSNGARRASEKRPSVAPTTMGAHLNQKRASIVPTSMATNLDRQKRMKLLERYMKQNDSSAMKLGIQNLQSTSLANPFALHFKAGHERAAKKKSQMRARYQALFQYMAYLNQKFGLSHFLLVLLLVVYSIIGGAIFNAIERPQEIEDLNNTYEVLQQKIANFTADIVFKVQNQSANATELQNITRSFYKAMLDLEGRLEWSTFDKIDDGRLQWDFLSGIFYATCIYTTIGYGTIVCATDWGKALTIVYGTIGIPLILVVLSDLGRVLLASLQKLYNHIYRIFR